MKRYIVCFALLLSAITPALAQDDEFITIHEFKSKSGVSLGQLKVRYISKEVFDSLRIVKTKARQEEVLYRIDKSGFYSRDDALEQEVYDPGFYGYKIASLETDHVVLTYMRNKGKSASDNIIIKWDADSAAFHKRWLH
jgi:hypothetical protein